VVEVGEGGGVWWRVRRVDTTPHTTTKQRQSWV
jgi:hypothetical protein